MKYKIEHKILTLAHNALMEKDHPASFAVDEIRFTHWNFNHTQGWSEDAWMAEAHIEAPNLLEAFKNFRGQLVKVIPRVSLIAQCYIEYESQPFLIHRTDKDVAFFRYTKDSDAVGLMFMERELEALNLLLKNEEIPEAFFYYWNDAVNATGYTPKLLLMFSAIEALAKKGGKKDWNKIELILGAPLTEDLFGTKENPSRGLRHRLVHGEYFDGSDSGKDYFDLVHKKVIAYFNDVIFSKKLIQENVVHPQRHLFGNKVECKIYIKPKGAESKLTLKEVLKDFDQNGIYNPDRYELIFDDSMRTTY